MRTNTFVTSTIAGLATLSLAACSDGATGGQETTSSDASDSAAEGSTVLIMNQPAGNPFADLVFAGLEQLADETGISAQQIPGVQAGAYDQQLRAAADAGNDPVVVLWDDLGNAVAKVAPDFPDTHFIIVDSAVDPGLNNVQSVLIDSTQSSYLAGVVAAGLTETKKVGFVGGQDMGVVNEWLCGFQAGIDATDPSLEVVANYAGTFTDPQKGQQIASALAGDGVDVIFQAANQTGLGVISGAADNGILAIGSDNWQGDVAEGSVPWSALKDAGQATYTVAKATISGDFTPGLYIFDAEKGAPLYDQRDFDALPSEIQDVVSSVEAELRDGNIPLNCR